MFDPSPLLTVTIESEPDSEPEIHLHAGGQGVWVARMAVVLGARARLCTALGGESGTLIRALLSSIGIEAAAVTCSKPNGVYVHDRRSGRRRLVAETPSPELSRHEQDDLFGLALTTGLDAGVMLLAGPRPDGAVAGELYERLARDLRAGGCTVLGDLTREPLHAALRGGLDVLKINDLELVDAGFADDDEMHEVARGMSIARAAGADSVVISRAAEPAIALTNGNILTVTPPSVTELDHRGAGDSMFAAIGVGLARGLTLTEAVRLGAAAGAMNVTRHGLGSGRLDQIEGMMGRVEITTVEGPRVLEGWPKPRRPAS